MEMVSTNIKTITYIESEAEFNRAKMQGFWDTMRSLITKCRVHLHAFDETIRDLPLHEVDDLGLRDISIRSITGSVGREQDYTCHFLPRNGNQSSKERWRRIYTLAVTGTGFPPVELYKVREEYFAKDGHHRISVAKYLKWGVIQAYVIEVSPLNFSSSNLQISLSHGVELCTQL